MGYSYARKKIHTPSNSITDCPDVSVDGGNILKQYRFDINKGDNSIDLENKLINIVEKTLANDLILYMEGKILLMPQNSNVESSTTDKYEQYKEIRFEEETSDEIRNKVLSYPYLEPFCFCYFKSKNIKHIIKNIDYYDKKDIKISSGEYIIKRDKVLFGTKNGVVCVRLFVDMNYYGSMLLLFNNKR
ncbi:MAG: hypothetical protein MUF50_04770 [Planctomycetes bacterium]|nr:hypothetical protein [Planctomycetota bacterium]